MAGTRILFYGQLQTVLVAIVGVGCGLTAEVAVGQIVPDDTLGDESSVVVEVDASIDGIVGGATRGANLFHSFSEFNVNEGRGVVFENPAGIENILTRVTGGNVSEILGALGVDGNANLFLINPNGITFGPDASLFINGSFVASTADSILFNNEFEFSATNPTAPPLLTVNTPIGLGFRDNPGEIVNRSVVENNSEEVVGLEVAPGENLAFVGGNVTFEAGKLTARGGNVELGGLSTAGTVSFNDDGSLNFPEDVAKADVILSNGATIDVTFTDGGSVNINAKNFELTSESKISTGIAFNASDAEARSGNITISTTEDILIDGGIISNLIFENGLGNTGKIEITASNITFTNGGRINNFNSGQGNLGDISLTASENITFDGIQGSATSGISNSIFANGLGNTGKIEITASNITFTNGGRINNFNSGQGNLGDISLTASENITFDGIQGIFSSGIVNFINLGAIGDTGNINITAKNLTITNAASISSGIAGIASTSGDVEAHGNIIINTTEDILIDRGNVSNSIFANGLGNTGRVEISARNITFNNGGRINNFNNGQGNLGDIILTASETIIFDGVQDFSANGVQILVPSGIANSINLEGVGNTGSINIAAKNLTITNGGEINNVNSGQGNLGNIILTASENITFDFASGIVNSVNPEAVGKLGNINIGAKNFSISNGAFISNGIAGIASTSSDIEAQAENITISTTEDILIDGGNVSNSIFTNGSGNTGRIEITARNISFNNGGGINNVNNGQGNLGDISLTASENITFDGTQDFFVSGIINFISPEAVGETGNINIAAENLNITNGASISSEVAGMGNSSNINISAENIDIDGQAEIFLTDETSLFLPSRINSEVSLSGSGNTGDINLVSQNFNLTNSGQISTLVSGGFGNAGDINIASQNLNLINNGQINTVSFGQNSGNVGINVEDTVVVSNNSSVQSSVLQESIGNAGEIEITASNVVLSNSNLFSNSISQSGNAGNILLEVSENVSIDHGTISSAVLVGGIGNAGEIKISGTNLSLINNSDLNTGVATAGNAGSINLKASDTFSADNSVISSNIGTSEGISATGNVGSISVEAQTVFISNTAQLQAGFFTGAGGEAGNIKVTADDTINFIGENTGIFTNAELNSFGDGSNIQLTANSIILDYGAVLTASSRGKGNGGNILIETNNFRIDNESTIETSTRSIGNAGSLSIFTNILNISNQSNIQTSTFDSGNAGSLKISTNTLSLNNGSIEALTDGKGKAGNINIVASESIDLNNSANITASVFLNASGEGGSILVETSQLRTSSGGQISTSTLGKGNAGNLTIIASELIELTGLSERGRSGLFANAFVSSGNGGDLFIFTDDLIIQDGAAIDVSNFQSLGLLEPGTGEAGNLIVEAESITLDRQGLINAATTTGEGGNITLEIADNLILRENSTISARAFNEANGGNLTINARFIIAFPSDGIGNDIIATAERGTGGNINLEAQQIFNLEQRGAVNIQGDLINNSTNDLDASSNFSFDGVVETNTLDVDPGSGLVELPETVIDPDALIGQNACRQGRESSLVVTGRGGLPPSSNPNTVNQDLIQVNPIIPLEEKLSHSPTPSTSTETSSEPQIVPAQGWVVNQQGEIYLVSYNPANTNNTRKSDSSQCQP